MKTKGAERGVRLPQFVAAKPWMQMFGRLKHLKKETARIQRLIDDEFEKIEPEDRG